jgi:hypothetical protein
MSILGSLAECRLLAKNPLKLPGGFRVRPRTPLMAAVVKGFGRLRTKASSAGTRGPHALVYG